jgi:hypothetical protein
MRLLVAALVAALVVVAPAAASSGYFETPSKNIVCGYFSVSGPPKLLECGVVSGLHPVAPKPAGGCHGLDAITDRIRLNTTGKTYGFCSCDAGVIAEAGRAPVLHYGTTKVAGAFKCTAALSGLTCRNSQGHGFFVSRRTWKSF